MALWSDRPAAFNDLHEQTVRLVAGLLSTAHGAGAAVAAHQLLLAERTATIAALRAGEERFRTLVESIDDVVFRLDRQQRCVDIMGRWLAREGYRPGDFLGRARAEIVGRRASGLHERANLRALAGETVTYEWTSRVAPRPAAHADHPLAARAAREGEVAGIVGLGRDITQRIEAEQQIRQAQKMEAVGRFAGGVAHDLNNMMMIILGFSDFLLSTLEQQDPRRADADEIRKAAERAMHLTRQLLGFGRQRLVAREVVSLNAVVEGMERMLRPLLGEDITARHRPRPRAGRRRGGLRPDGAGRDEPGPQRSRRHARRRALTIETLDVDFPDGYAYRPGVDIPAGPYVLLVVSDTGQGMTAEVKVAPVRAVLHHQAGHPEHRPRPDHGLRHRGPERRLHLGGHRAGPGRRFQLCFPRVLVDDAGGSWSSGGRRPRAAPRPCSWSRTRRRSGRSRPASSASPATP